MRVPRAPSSLGNLLLTRSPGRERPPLGGVNEERAKASKDVHDGLRLLALDAPAPPTPSREQEQAMKLYAICALLRRHGQKATVEIDRFDIKRAAGDIIGVDVMLTDGTVAYLSVEAG